MVTSEQIEELLDLAATNLDRLKTLYEQYFLGIQKQAPAFLHTDIERKLRDLTQLSIRNTGLRYRLATLQQKFGSYNSYWRRTLRQIENGTYFRNLSKVGRQAARTGEDIPEEILAAMPKRMRDQVLRDREQALAIAQRRGTEAAPDDVDVDLSDDSAVEIHAPPPPRDVRDARGALRLDEADGDIDLEKFFAEIEEAPPPPPPVARAPSPPPAPPAPPAPVKRPTVPPPARPSGGIPTIAKPGVPTPARMPSQATKPVPIAPGAAAAREPLQVEQMAGPFPKVPAAPTKVPNVPPVVAPPAPPIAAPRAPSAPPVAAPRAPSAPPVAAPRAASAPIVTATPKPAPPVSARAQSPTPTAPAPTPIQTATPRPAAPRAATQPGANKPPPGMTDADVNALYSKYVKAKEMLGENVGPGGYGKLLKTINAQAPRIMEQYKAKGVDFSVVVKDNQVIIKAKPKP